MEGPRIIDSDSNILSARYVAKGDDDVCSHYGRGIRHPLLARKPERQTKTVSEYHR